MDGVLEKKEKGKEEGKEEKKAFCRESEVGITEYLTESKGFSGRLKERYTDFIVREIGTEGETVSFSFSLLGEEKGEKEGEGEGKEKEKEEEGKEKENEEVKEDLSPLEDPERKKQLEELLGGEVAGQLVGFIRDTPKEKRTTSKFYIKPFSEKSQRGKAHALLRSISNLCLIPLESKTICDEKHHTRSESSDRPNTRWDNRKRKRVKVKDDKQERAAKKLRDDSSNDVSDGVSQEGEPPSQGEASQEAPRPEVGSIEVYFPRETKIVMNQRRQTRQEGKKQKTKFTEFVLFKENKDTTDVVNILSGFLNRRSSDFSFAGTKDKRGVTTQKMAIANVTPQTLLSLNSRLFGIKVGSIRCVMAPLRLGDLKGNNFTVAIRQLGGEDKDVGECVELVKEKGFVNYYGMQRFGNSSISTHSIGLAILRSNWKEAVDLILCPRNEANEEGIKARAYWAETRDVEGTLKILPKHLYIEKQVLRGLRGKEQKNFAGALGKLDRKLRMMYVHSYQSFIWNIAASERIKKYGLSVVVGDLVLKAKGKRREGEGELLNDKVAVVTEKDLVEGNFDITDVVLPLPGSEILYPKNEIQEVYRDILGKDQISLDFFEEVQKEYHLRGEYRCLIAKPHDVTWSIVRYEDDTEQLCPTDLDILENKKFPNVDSPARVEGSKRALVVGFSLPSSSYATMFFREIMKEKNEVVVRLAERRK